MSSAAEAEVAMVYLPGKAAIPVCTPLEEMGHPQGPNQLKTDNNTAESCLNEAIQKRILIHTPRSVRCTDTDVAQTLDHVST